MNTRVFLRRLLGLLPKDMRYEFFRDQLKINLNPSPSLEVKLAETEAELESAFRILHEAYVESGFMKPSPSGMRVTKYHALPSTSTLVAKWDGAVVATISIIRDGAFGLPLESSFDISSFREGGKRPVEISSLAILRDFRGNRGEVLLPLLKAMWLYCSKYFGVDDFLIAVNPRRVEFFESIFNYRKITEKVVEKYGFVNGAPAVGLYLNVAQARPLYAKTYYLKPTAKDLYSYMFDDLDQGRDTPNIKLPERSYFNVSDPIITPALFRTFFMEKTDVFDTLSLQEQKIVLAQIDPLPQRMRRHDVNFNARVFRNNNGISARVFNVSQHGFLLATNDFLPSQDFYQCQVHVSEFEVVTVAAKKVWDFGRGFMGFKLLKPTQEWEKMISHLDQIFVKKVFSNSA